VSRDPHETADPPGVSGTGADDLIGRLKAIVQSSAEAMIACDREGCVQTWNSGAATIFGREAEEVIGWPLTTLFPSNQREVVSCLILAAVDGHRSSLLRIMGLRPDGDQVDLSVTLAPTLDAHGAINGTCMVARDVSARRLAEEQAARDRAELQQREAALRLALASLRTSHEELKNTQMQLIRAAKLESIGRLAAGVAHEVKNPLAIILAGTDCLLSSTSLPAQDVQATLNEIRAAVRRASSVIGGLLNYSAATEITPAAADVNDVIEQALQLVHYALSRGHVEVVRALDRDLPRMSLDADRIQQVLVNLLMNALDAMPKGGTLTIRTRRTPLTAADPGVGVRRTDPFRVGQTVVRIEVEDSGTGIPDEHLSKVFDPFYSTKPTGKGTGLGLAVCKTIVAMHGGHIWIGNRPQGGAVATVVLRNQAA
jgi:PAS domain S-box-containing protein